MARVASVRGVPSGSGRWPMRSFDAAGISIASSFIHEQPCTSEVWLLQSMVLCCLRSKATGAVVDGLFAYVRYHVYG
jgi:hypothetical protein